MTRIVLIAGLAISAAIVLIAAWRVVRGPRIEDRLLAASFAANVLTFVLGIAGAVEGAHLYFDAALVTALISITATVVFARYVGTGRAL